MEYWMASNETGHNAREETIQEVLKHPGSAILFLGYPPWLLHFAASCCILFMLVGIPGNLFTIIALCRTKKLRNATAIFIINLSISDLMFCCFNLPLATSTFWHSSWNHGALLCQLFPLLRYGLVAVSLFTILSITINRYVMIGHPKLYRTVYKGKYLIPMVLSTWIIAFGVLIVTWFGSWGRFGLDIAIGSCSILPDANGRSPKEFLFVVAFLIPCIAIVVCYARIFCIVRKAAFKSRKPHVTADNVNTDVIDISQEQRPASGRKQEVPSTFKSNYTSTVPYDVCLKQPTMSNQLNNSENEEESKMQQHSSNYTEKKEREFWKNDENVLEKIDDIPYADERCDESEVMESEIFAINNKMKESFGKRGNKLERIASRASFIIESSIWVERLESSRTNSPDRLTKKQATIIPRESTFKSVRRRKKHDGPVKMSNKDRKLLKMILVIFSSFLICYLPITITKTFKDAIDWRGLNIASYILIYLTTCINPVVYVVMSSEYRSAYKNVLFCRNEIRKEARKSLE
nr:G-protein coupled receptor moody [Osmia lignaria]